MLCLLARGGADHFAIDHEIDARFALMGAAADEEGEVVAIDREVRRSERAAGAVAIQKRIHQSVSQKSINVLLVGKRSARWTFAERLAGGGPAGVIFALKIGEKDVIGGESRGNWNTDEKRKCPADHIAERNRIDKAVQTASLLSLEFKRVVAGDFAILVHGPVLGHLIAFDGDDEAVHVGFVARLEIASIDEFKFKHAILRGGEAQARLIAQHAIVREKHAGFGVGVDVEHLVIRSRAYGFHHRAAGGGGTEDEGYGFLALGRGGTDPGSFPRPD